MSDKVSDRISESMSRLLGADYGSESVDGDGGGAKQQRDRLNHRLASLEMRRQANIESVLTMAYAVAGTDEIDGPAPDVEDDWLTRFVGHAQEVGNPVMQTVWGQVLAQETGSPNGFSLRTLDVLADMTAEDWGTWKRAGRLCFPTGYLLKLGTRNEFDEFEVTRSDIERLQTLGMVQETDDLSVTFYAPTKGLTFDFVGANLVVRHPASTLFTLPAYRVTGAALEIFRQLGADSADGDYLEALGESLRASGYDFRLRETD
jgi:hypothetical protein